MNLRSLAPAFALGLFTLMAPSPAHADVPAPDTAVTVEDTGSFEEVRAELPPPTDADLLALADATANSAPEDPDTPPAPPEPEPTDTPTTAPVTGDGCLLDSPWDDSAQSDDDCDRTANVCENLPPNSYALIVQRGYGKDGDYCIPTSTGTLLPPFPSCVTTSGADDYDCDGTADYYKPSS